MIKHLFRAKRRVIKIYGWLTNSPSQEPWFEIDPYYSPFGKDVERMEIPRNHKLKPAATGWCSWYAFGQNINVENVLENARWFLAHRDRVPIEYVQIDDGYTLWGDWQIADKKKFPSGLRKAVLEIKELGFKAGIWFSPFLIDLDSQVAQKHPDWVLRNKNGDPVYGHAASVLLPGIFWKKRYVLNTHHPEAYKYILECIDYFVREVGFELLKIDFMCGPYYDPAYTDSSRPDNLVHMFLSYVKSTYPEVYTLTGVSPIAPTVGLTDGLRISDDIIIPPLRGKWPINAIVHSQRLKQLERNLKARKKLAKIWNLDPDVFVCGSDVGFSEAQIQKLFELVKEAGGVKFLGDDMTKLSKERLERWVYPLFSK